MIAEIIYISCLFDIHQFQAYSNGMYGQDYVWIVTSTPDVNETSDWWVPQPSDKLTCTRSQMEEALDHHFTFYYKNEINATLVSGKVLYILLVGSAMYM